MFGEKNGILPGVQKGQGTPKPSLEITDQDFKALSNAFASLAKVLSLVLCTKTEAVQKNLRQRKNPHILSILGSIFFYCWI